jgi:hypothetical protein
MCETLESVAVSGLVLSLGVENANAIQEAFKFSQFGPVLLVASWLLHRVDGTILFPLLVVALGRARLVHVARLLLLSGVEGRLLSQGVLNCDSQHLFRYPEVLHGLLADQGWVFGSLLEEHDNWFAINLRNEVPLVAKMLDELSEWLSLLLDNTGQVPLDSCMCAFGTEVAIEQPTQMGPRMYWPRGESYEPHLGWWR